MIENLTRSNQRLPTAQQGYSVIELMIASVIGLIVLSGAVTVFTSNKASQEMSSGMARIQESGRAALEILSNDIRLAGYQGCTDGAAAPVVIATEAPAIALPNGAIWGAEVGATGWDPAQPADLSKIGTKASADNDVIYIQHGSGRTTILARSMADRNENPITLQRNPDQIDDGDLMIISNCSGADIFRATTVGAMATDPTTGLTGVQVSYAASLNDQANLNSRYAVTGSAQADAMRVMRFESNAYFVGDSGRVDAAGNTIMSLFVLDTSAATIADPTELVEGVEKLQILYGERLLNGKTRYLSADDASLNMNRVTSVQIGLLIGSIDPITSSNDTNSYQVADQIVGPPGGTTSVKHAGDRQMRSAFNATVRLRNRNNL